jgi:formylglycine-generating enzyme required for sulfatase activity
MKTKLICLSALMCLTVSAVFFSGCAKTVPEGEIMVDTVVLPKNFVVVQGLSDCGDYDEENWPRYIMNCKDGSVMVLIPETTYVMGSKAGRPDEVPVHTVSVDKFYIDLYEVSNAQFSRFAKAMRCNGCFVKKQDPCLSTARITIDSNDPILTSKWRAASDECYQLCDSLRDCCMNINSFKKYWVPCVNDCHPARAVSFWEAWYYTRWVGKDLPTEAEWELAAKGTDDRLYPWGDIQPDSQNVRLNYIAPSQRDGADYAASVTSYAAGRSPFGVYNMAGNVWEWTKDFYDSTAYSVTQFAAGDEARCTLEVDREFVNPQGPMFGCSRVIRGGAFTSELEKCRTTFRNSANPNYHGMNIGFRGVLRIR